MTNELSKEEASTYDRQIRLWGVNTQSRIRSTRILFVGLGGINAEVAKNLTLSGIGHITLLDSKLTKESDIGTNFLLTEESIGVTRAEGCIKNLRELNPLVDIQCSEEPLTNTFISSFNLVIANEIDPIEEERLDVVCRSCNIPFISSHSFGFKAILFLDLIQISYKDDKKKPVGNEKNQEEEKDILINLTYPSLETIRQKKWSTIPRIGKVNKLYLAFAAFQVFLKERNSKNETQDISFHEFFLKFCQANEVNCSLVSEDILQEFEKLNGVELSPVCAIMGGIIGQEVIKIISGVGSPIYNFFCFDSMSGQGVIEPIACQ